MNQVESNGSATDAPLVDGQEDHWNDSNCMKCGASQTPMWRLGPEGDKNMCNACGIRWKRNQEGVPLETEKTIRKRTKKKSELEILMRDDNGDVFVNGKRSRVKQQLCDDLQHMRDSPSSANEHGKMSTSCPQNSFLSSQEMDVDGSSSLQRFNDAPFPFLGKMEGKSKAGVPVQSLRRSVGEINPSESPFRSNFSSSVPFSTVTSTPVSTPTPSATPSNGDRSAEIDVNLLRQILTRLENLRKEHRKTTEQVQIMVAELEANPELYSASNGTEMSSGLRNGTNSAHNTGSSPFPMSSSVPFQRSSPLARSHNRRGSDH